MSLFYGVYYKADATAHDVEEIKADRAHKLELNEEFKSQVIEDLAAIETTLGIPGKRNKR